MLVVHQNTDCGMLKIYFAESGIIKCSDPLPVNFVHDAVLEAHGDHRPHHQGRADQVGPVGWDVEYSHLEIKLSSLISFRAESSNFGLFLNNLEDVGSDNLEAPHDHDLAWRDPAHGLGHQDAPEDPDQRHHEAQDPHPIVPVLEQRPLVDGKHSDDADNQAADSEPEHEDRVVNMLGLSGDDHDEGGEQGDGHGGHEAHKLVAPVVGVSLPRLTAGVGDVVAGAGRGEQRLRPREDEDAAQQHRGDDGPPDTAVIFEDEERQDLDKT